LIEIKSLATRKSSELTLNALTSVTNNLIGGSADLAGSNNTKTKHHKIVKPGEFNGNYIHYGVREHAMSGIMNGLALHSNFIPLWRYIFNIFRLLQTINTIISINAAKSYLCHDT
jgi:transketolase